MIRFELDDNRILTEDKILFGGAYPILFTCKDQSGRLYYCVCCQNNEDGRRWLISETTAGSILRLLRNEVTSRELLLESLHWSVISNEQGVKMDNDPHIWEEDSRYLPKKDSFLEPDEGEFDEEIRYYTGFTSPQKIAEYSFNENKIDFIVRITIDMNYKGFNTEYEYIPDSNDLWVA